MSEKKKQKMFTINNSTHAEEEEDHFEKDNQP